MCPGQSLALKCSATLFSGQSDIHVSCFLQQFLPRYSTCTLQFTILHTFTLHIPNTYTSNYIQTKPIIVFNIAFKITIYHLIIHFCGFTKNYCSLPLHSTVPSKMNCRVLHSKTRQFILLGTVNSDLKKNLKKKLY